MSKEEFKSEHPFGPLVLPNGIVPITTHPEMARVPVRVWCIEPGTSTVMVRDTEGYVHGDRDKEGAVTGPWTLSWFWYFGKCACECDPMSMIDWLPEVAVFVKGNTEAVEILPRIDDGEQEKWFDLTCEFYPIPILVAVIGEHAELFQSVAHGNAPDWHETAISLLGDSYSSVLKKAFKQ